MNFIAVITTFIIGFLSCLLFSNSLLPCIFPVATMGFFILKKLDKLEKLYSEKSKEGNDENTKK